MVDKKERTGQWGMDYLNRRMRKAIWYSLHHNKNSRHWESLVDYSWNSLRKHLKSTMPEGYIWNDYLKGKLHLDHIDPISAFNFAKPEHGDFKRCWALSNLRLLPAKKNIAKKNKLVRPFQPALKFFPDSMPKIQIGFETSKEFKQRVVEAGKNYKIDGITNPVNLSMICRIAVARLVSDIEEKEREVK